MTNSETRLQSGEGVVGFEMVGDLFVNLAFKDLRKTGYDRQFGSKVSPPLKRGMTAVAVQSLLISDDTKER
jgi:hypothetical protein